MGKKYFNWFGFFLILGFLVIAAFLCMGLYVAIRDYRAGDYYAFYGILFFAIFLGCYLLLGGAVTYVLHHNSSLKLATKVAAATAPTLTCSARVLSKATQVVGDFNSTETAYYISFELSDGTRKTFSVNIFQYGEVVEKETGFLTYQEQDGFLFFIGFQHQS